MELTFHWEVILLAEVQIDIYNRYKTNKIVNKTWQCTGLSKQVGGCWRSLCRRLLCLVLERSILFSLRSVYSSMTFDPPPPPSLQLSFSSSYLEEIWARHRSLGSTFTIPVISLRFKELFSKKTGRKIMLQCWFWQQIFQFI